MKKFILLNALLLASSASFASVDDVHNINLGIGYTGVSEYKETGMLSYDFLPYKVGNNRYGITVGGIYTKFDKDPKGYTDKDKLDITSVFLGATGKHYFNQSVYLKGTAGYNYGWSEVDFKYAGKKVAEVKGDISGLYGNLELGYEFKNGISLGTYYAMTQYDYHVKDYANNERQDSRDWFNTYGIKIGYTF